MEKKNKMFDVEKVKELFRTIVDQAYFWSGLGKDGATIAEKIAREKGGTTLEMLMEKNKDALIDAGFPYDIDMNVLCGIHQIP